MLVSMTDYIAWGLLVVPLFGLLWVGLSLLMIAREHRRYERYLRFYKIMQQLSQSETAAPNKMAAAYELRRYREYEPILRKVFVDGQVRTDNTGEMVKNQLKETLNQMQ